MTPEHMRATWELYGKAWSPVSDSERRALLKESLASDFVYVEPRISCDGQAQLIENLEAFQQRQPGGGFALRDLLAHHDIALVNWQLIKADGTASNRGYDFVRFNDAGVIASIAGFFAKPTT